MNLPEDLSKDLERIARFVLDDEKGEPFEYKALAQVDRVEDGDTWLGRRKPDPMITIEQEQRNGKDGDYYRLTGIDAHETNADSEEARKKAKKEKEFVEKFVAKGQEDWDGDWPFVVIFDDKQDEYEGTYGRPLTDLVRRSDGLQLSVALVEEFGDEVKYKPNEN